RHGSTKLNAGAKGSGNSSECVRAWLDVPLSPEGVKEAKALAKELCSVSFDGIYSSDLDRAEATAKIISDTTKVPILGVTRGLRPWDLGHLAGKKVEDCVDIIHEHIEDKPDEAIKDGESFNSFKCRFLDFLDEIRQKHDGQCIAIVSHHRNERLLAG